MFDLHRLRLLRELKHRGTLAAVAAAMSYSPSSISQQLSQLETEVGVPLLEAVGRRVRLTTQAEILVGHTEAVLERLECAEAEIATSLTDLAGTLRIAAFQTAALSLIPTALTMLGHRHPQLRVHLTQAEPETAIPALLARDYDMVMTEEYPGSPNARPAELEQEALCDDLMRLAVPTGRGYGEAESAQATLASLAEHPWAMEPTGSAARRWAVSVCREAGFEPDVRFESEDLLVHLRLVEHGHAAAFLPDLLWNGGRPTVALRTLPTGNRARRILTVVRGGRSLHPAVIAGRRALAAAAHHSAAG